MKLSFLPKAGKFFILFEQDAQVAVKIAKSLRDLLHDWKDVEEKVHRINDLEHEGDSVTHEIIAQLHRTFVTPFDREDIALLAHSLDDVTDFIEATADAMLLYRIDRPTARSEELADIIVQLAVEVERAIAEINRHVDLKQVLNSCVEINRLENTADRVYRSALAELFKDEKDMANIIKWREIYEYMENATDRCEDVANVLEGVALKYG